MPRLREPPKKEEETIKAEGEQLEQGLEQQEEQIEVVQAEAPDAVTELQKQIDALRRSEEAAKARAAQAEAGRDQAMRLAQERDVMLGRRQQEAADSRLESIKSGMAAAEAEALAAKDAMKMATAQEDIDALIAAQERLAEAKANLVNLTNGKAALEQAIAEAKQRAQFQQQQPPQGDRLDQTNLPENAKHWLRAHPEYMNDPRKNAQIQAKHWDVVDEGHAPFSASYYESLEQHLGLREKPARHNDAEETDTRRSIVSAPVTREAPSSGGARSVSQVRLTAAQRESAKLAGITEAEYAKQLLKLNEAKANGSYGGQP